MKRERTALRLLCALLLQGSLLPCAAAGEAAPPPGATPGEAPQTAAASAAGAIQVPAATGGFSPVTRALRASGPVHLDGILDEEDWSRAEPITSFTQRFPAEGQEATEA